MSKCGAVLQVWVVLVVSAVWGCSSQPVLRMPARLTAVPGTAAVDRNVDAARQLMEQGDHPEALAAIEEVLSVRPQHVDAHRVRQQLLQSHGRTGLLAWEAEQRLRRHPKAAWAHYLAGRIHADDDRKLKFFQRAIELDNSFFWGWFGLAFVKRSTDPRIAKEVYQRLYRAARGQRLVALAYGALLRAGVSTPKAVQVYNSLQKRAPGVAAIGVAQTHVATGAIRRAWPHVLTALRERPLDPAVRDLIRRYLAQGVADDRVHELLDILRQDPATLDAFAKDGSALLATLFHRVGEGHAALEVLLRRRQPRTPHVREMLLTLLLGAGDVAGFLGELRQGFPVALLDDEANQVRGPWVALLRGPWVQQDDPLATPAQALALIRALVRVGLLDHAERLSSMALLRFGSFDIRAGDGGGDGAGDGANGTTTKGLLATVRELRTEIRKEIAFEAGLRRMINRGYELFTRRGEAPRDLKYFLADLRKLSQQTLGKDVVGDPQVFQVPFVGRLMDSFGAGLGQHLAGYNKHLVLGQRNGRPVECMMMTRLSLRVVDAVPGLDLPANCREVVGMRREIVPLLQHDLAGIALLNHYVVDMDQVRSWALTLQEQRDIARSDEMLLRDPLPEDVDPALPLDVDWRLNLMSPVEDSALETAVLDLIRWHEQGHMVDFRYFLPPTLHPWRALALLFRNGLSAARIAGEMEARAELAALAKSPYTRLVLAHIAGFLAGDAGDSPHADGFRRLAQRFGAELGRRGQPDPGVYRWHEVDPEVARDIGEQLLKTLW
ncbi:MAG: tetratricopeptide repeat protein [Planctomycetota bacterium]|jgi:tetratricopeptide (TPR) repeat protein